MHSMLLALVVCQAPDQASAQVREQSMAALAPIASLVGDWKGTGQVRRGRTEGAWRENQAWSYRFADDGSASIAATIREGRHAQSIVIHPAATAGQFEVEVISPTGTKQRLIGRLDRPGRLVAEAPGSPPAEPDAVARITLDLLHGTRLVTRYEGRDPESTRFRPLGEVGATREGVRFAAGDAYPECVVTGGRGTISVSFEGKSYFVCCSGCKDLFDENPRAILDSYAARKKAR